MKGKRKPERCKMQEGKKAKANAARAWKRYLRQEKLVQQWCKIFVVTVNMYRGIGTYVPLQSVSKLALIFVYV